MNHVGEETRLKEIFFLVSSMQAGGSERVASLLSDYWVSRKHNVTLVVTYSDRGENLFPLDERVQLVFLADLLKNPSKNKLINRIKRFFALRQFIIESRPDVIVSFLTEVNVVALLLSMGTNIPVIVSERTDPARYSGGYVWDMARKYSYQFAKWVVVQTDDIRNWIEENCPNANVKVIPNPVKIPLPSSMPIVDPSEILPDDHNLILSAGRLEKEKGYSRLIEAFATIGSVDERWDLVILGEGTERGKLENKITSLKLKEYIHLPGRVGNLGDWYQRADIFVLSSYFEGFPNALLEAMAHGLSVVSIDCSSGPREMIEHEINGLLVPEENVVTGLTQAVSHLIQDETARRRLSLNAKQVITRFSIEKIGRMWEDIL